MIGSSFSEVEGQHGTRLFRQHFESFSRTVSSRCRLITRHSTSSSSTRAWVPVTALKNLHSGKSIRPRARRRTTSAITATRTDVHPRRGEATSPAASPSSPSPTTRQLPPPPPIRSAAASAPLVGRSRCSLLRSDWPTRFWAGSQVQGEGFAVGPRVKTTGFPLGWFRCHIAVCEPCGVFYLYHLDLFGIVGYISGFVAEFARYWDRFLERFTGGNESFAEK